MKRKIRLVSFVILLGIYLACAGYIDDYYRAENVALKSATKAVEKDGNLIFEAEQTVAGLIFYPGGKVQCESYAPLLEELSEQGITSVLVRMPANLAVLDMNAADGIQDEFPEIDNWYIGGHSLGGSMAANYAAKHAEDYTGVLLLAAYSTSDLHNLDVLSIYGTQDEVLNAEKYKEYRTNLPEDFCEVIIEGGCHAYFGSYGAQEGDGLPSISNEEQLQITQEEILKWMTD